jgi:hypothetical protein
MRHTLSNDTLAYNNSQSGNEKVICEQLATIICQQLPNAENKVWHGHPVWFLDENPIVGYSKEKKGMRLMFWSGADFEEPALSVLGKKFKDASIFYNNPNEIHQDDLIRWLEKSRDIQWDYKNIVKRKGVLLRLK